MRRTSLLVLFAVLPLFAAQAHAREKPTLAKIVVDKQAVVGELIEDTEEYVRILDLRTDEPRTLRKDQTKSVRVGISEREAALSVGLPTFLAWNIRRTTPTGRTSTVAILPLCDANGRETVEGREFAESLTTELVRNDVRVVERRLLDKVLRELSMQNSSGFDPLTAQRIGKQLGAYVVLTGTIVPKNKVYEAQLRLLQVETGEILFAASHTMRDVKDRPEPVADQPEPVVVVKPKPVMPKKTERPSNVVVVKPVPVPQVVPKLDIKLKWSLEGHTAPVVETIISPDDTLAASSSKDGTVRLWSLETGKCIRVIEPDGGPCEAIAFSLDGSVLASGSVDGKIKVWDVNSGTLIQTCEGFSAPVTTICFEPVTNRMKRFWAGAADGKQELWNIPSQKSSGGFDHGSPINYWTCTQEMSPRTWAWCSDKKIKLIIQQDENSDAVTHILSDRPAHCLKFSPDNSILASSSLEDCIRLWDAKTGQELLRMGRGWSTRRFDFTPDGSMIVAMHHNRGTIKVLEVSTGDFVLMVKSHEPRIWSLDITSDGRALVSGGDDKLVKVWDVQYQ